MLYTELITLCSEILTKHKYTMRAERRVVECYTGGAYSNHWAVNGKIAVTNTSQLMLHRKVIAVCSDIHTKHIYILCGQNIELMSVKLVTTGL
jgi:hypothetical protein